MLTAPLLLIVAVAVAVAVAKDGGFGLGVEAAAAIDVVRDQQAVGVDHGQVRVGQVVGCLIHGRDVEQAGRTQRDPPETAVPLLLNAATDWPLRNALILLGPTT